MRKPRDFDAELKALTERAKQLRTRKQSQLGELVIATGADSLSPDELAGALLALAQTTDRTKREAWRRRGEAFFQGKRDQSRASAADQQHSEPQDQVADRADTGQPGAA
ncbi:conjugal transfer protein TraD [Sphingomonas sp. FW199]|uniref:conjugal transfer protein TraD n=1 Tax=Sphingomonas sp. FW199 TaxID=3400217 RepID=UPI003CF69424